MNLYRELLHHLNDTLNMHIFAVAIQKHGANTRGWGPLKAAWTFTFQRINRFCGDAERAMIFPDEGTIFYIRRTLRRMRRFHHVPLHWGGGTAAFPVSRIVEDPNSRRSQDSYFIQLADWCAYAAHRYSGVHPVSKTPDDLWDELASVLVLDVNKLRGGPPGIVRYP
jgi:hypothetical protein